MENKFIKVTCITNGHEWDVIINENDIARLTYGVNIIECKTPFQNGSHCASVTQGEFNKLEKLLLGGDLWD